MRPSLFLLPLLAAFSLHTHAAANVTGYQLPAPELQALVDAPRGPLFALGPRHQRALLTDLPGLPSIQDVAQPELKLAGLRINPRTRAASRFDFGTGLSLLDIASGTSRPVSGLPADVKIADSAWSPDERWLAFSVWAQDGVELWLLDAQTAQAKRLLSDKLNAITGHGFAWSADSQHLLLKLLPQQQTPAPRAPMIPHGPTMLESASGKVTQNRTYPDMLKNAADADLLEWELQAQLAWVNLQGEVTRIGNPAPFLEVQAAPDASLILTTQVRRPYSYLLPLERFPQTIAVWDAQGKLLKTIAERPLRERLPAGNDAVQTGPREFGWRADQPATLYWLEAQAGGDPEVKSKVHDILYQQAAPFSAAPQKLLELGWRFGRVEWGDQDLALVTENWWKSRDTRTWRIHPGHPEVQPELLFARKSEDRYRDPGQPVHELNQYGRKVLHQDDKHLLLIGEGASEEGDRPFLDRYDLASKQSTRLWRSQAPYYEMPLALLDAHGNSFISSREAADQRPNFFVHEGDKAARALTQFAHPTPQFKDVQKQQIRYKRADGVDLSATLYLPPGYDPKRDGPRPMLMWAYPREFKTAAAASEVSGSPYKFNRISYSGPHVMLARGYTVLDGPAMPIIGEGKQEPNDSYIKQLVMDAQAAVDEVVRLGVTDREHIAIGGHSYGAFMTANLLTHSKLFRTGIARSGAYNRTLTPFGFQSEDRNYWQAMDVYQAMSPFNFADKIQAPILLIHGEMDNNTGTFPIQSERYYQALQGLGKTARLVLLPNEAHGYRARESILHMLWEEDQWLEKYLGKVEVKTSAGN